MSAGANILPRQSCCPAFQILSAAQLRHEAAANAHKCGCETSKRYSSPSGLKLSYVQE